mmetsp:Transcript_33363/g.85246  ORF Transcript_33363/g.85246 Transcript_33363/m.85246 type:complete len:241 (-) Transcript_33363:1617-2339(-)
MGAGWLHSEDVVLEAPVAPLQLHIEERLRLLAPQRARQDDDHGRRLLARLRKVVPWAVQADIGVLVHPRQKVLAGSATERGDVLKQPPVCLLRVTQLLLDVPQSRLGHGVACKNLHHFRSRKHLDHGLALVVRVHRDRARPIVEAEELSGALHITLFEEVDLSALQGHNEATMDDDEEEVSIWFLVDDYRLIGQQPAGLELSHKGLQQPVRRIVDEAPCEGVFADGVEQNVPQGICTRHA